jgi:hypothetical protein
VRRHLIRLALTLGLSALLPDPAAAQAPPVGPPSGTLRPGSSTLWAPSQPPAAARELYLLPDSARGTNYAVVGLAIGAGLGFVAGWAFYDVLCEAVDNRCSDSRLPTLVVGTALGGGLGALIGSAVD